MKNDYYKRFEAELKTVREYELNTGKKKTLLLHSCCAPCSTAVIDAVKDYFDVTVFYYNPNITDGGEYSKRLEEQKSYCKKLGVPVIEGLYDTKEFFTAIKGKEHIKEGGERCFLCYLLRLNATKSKADELEYDYFCSTLSLSPYKNADKLNEIGESLVRIQDNGDVIGAKYLYNDFKKKNGYLNSIKLSEKFGLYRQNYCGCIFSKLEAEEERTAKRSEKEAAETADKENKGETR